MNTRYWASLCLVPTFAICQLAISQKAQNNQNHVQPPQVASQVAIQTSTQPLQPQQIQTIQGSIEAIRGGGPQQQRPQKPTQPLVQPLTQGQQYDLNETKKEIEGFLSNKEAHWQSGTESGSTVNRNGLFMAYIVTDGKSAMATSTVSPERALELVRQILSRSEPNEQVNFRATPGANEVGIVRDYHDDAKVNKLIEEQNRISQQLKTDPGNQRLIDRFNKITSVLASGSLEDN